MRGLIRGSWFICSEIFLKNGECGRWDMGEFNSRRDTQREREALLLAKVENVYG